MVANAGTIPRQEQGERGHEWAIALVASAAGFIDATGYVLLAHLFTAHMSGNTVAAGESLGSGDWAEAARRAFPIPWFVVGILTGRILTDDGGAEETARPPFANAAILAIEAAALAGAIGVGVTAPYFRAAMGWGAGGTELLCTALLSFAMGIQNLALRRSDGGPAVRTTYISGTLTQFLEDVVSLLLARYRRRGERNLSGARRDLRLYGGIYAGYFLGAVVAGGVLTLLHSSPWWSLLLPLMVLVGLALHAGNSLSRSERRKS